MLDLIIKNGQCYINGKLENKDIAAFQTRNAEVLGKLMQKFV